MGLISRMNCKNATFYANYFALAYTSRKVPSQPS